MALWAALAPFAPAIGNVVGSLLGGNATAKAQASANRTNIALQRENQAWEERMSSSSWQRGVQDMQKAGVNPMLSFTQGGASTPTTAAARVESTGSQWADIGKHVGSAAGQVLQQRLLQEQINNVAANTETAKATAANVQADTQLKNSTALTQAETRNQIIASIDETQWRIDKLQKEVRGLELDNKQKENGNAVALEIQRLEAQAMQSNNQQLIQETMAKTAGWREWLAKRGIQIPAVSIPFIGGAKK